MTTLHGADLSHYQTGLNVAAAGLDFVILKATEGTGYVDVACDGFYQQAKAAGVLRGVYHFYRGDPAAEADHFVRTIGGYIGDALLALDFEDSKYQHDVAGAKAFLDRVHDATGVRPVIYMNRSFLTGSDWSPLVADYGLWLARYSSETGSIAPWPALALWQYTSSGTVPGYAGSVDLDWFYGDRNAWAAYASGYAPDVDPTPTPTPEVVYMDPYIVRKDSQGTAWLITAASPKPVATPIPQGGFTSSLRELVILDLGDAFDSFMAHAVTQG